VEHWHEIGGGPILMDSLSLELSSESL
jgi:hypothetical protein